MNKTLKIKLLEREFWWGGMVDDGVLMPYGSLEHHRDLSESSGGNQSTPLLLSSKGRYIWSEMPYTYHFSDGELSIASRYADLECGECCGNLREVYRHVSRKFFPPSGIHPDLALFTAPQYNLWIELLYCPTQEKVLEYAGQVLKHGMAPGVIMIDDNWQESYGSWEFHSARFPDPRAMTDELHRMGFKVMVWICPFITPDTVTFRELRNKGFLLNDLEGKTAIRDWWNGHSAVLDCTHPGTVEWFHDQVNRLFTKYGIDGIKLDAGDPEFYKYTDISYQPSLPNEHCRAWAEIGLRYPLNEYRSCWKMAGQPLVQRLRDKSHEWKENGLASLIPNGLAQGLAGYAFNCPDMIGGGEYLNFTSHAHNLNQELFVRYAQCSALFPMMQFSAAPWRVLDKEHLGYCIEAAKLHVSMGDEIIRLVKEAADTGEPIMRHMAYVFHDGGFEQVTDQFLLGDDILVAPVLEKGAVTRKIRFPEGTWKGDDGSLVQGPCIEEVSTPLSRLPWYRRIYLRR